MLLVYGRALNNGHRARRLYGELYSTRRLPSHDTFANTYRRLRETGKLQHREPGVRGRPLDVAVDERILAAFDDDPTISIRKVATELGFSVWKVWSVLRNHCKHPFHLTPVQGLSENRLYLDYVEYCKERQVVPEKASFYKFIFTNEFNYGFHRPKKDQCDHCIQFKNRPEHEQQLHKEEYDLHIIRKNEARKHKVLDKNRTKVDPGFIAFAMDLEKLLLAPNLQAGQVYYKRKLKIYNFTLYNLGDSEATNYMWHEGVGTKGASEIATCIWMHLSSLAPEIKEITLFSDTASGQNRNTIIAAMFLHAVTVLPIQTINQKFMESGHSEMECDSVHSAVENRGRHVDIYTPEGWYTVARTAKTTKPYYKIKELTYSDFIDFKSYKKLEDALADLFALSDGENSDDGNESNEVENEAVFSSFTSTELEDILGGSGLNESQPTTSTVSIVPSSSNMDISATHDSTTGSTQPTPSNSRMSSITRPAAPADDTDNSEDSSEDNSEDDGDEEWKKVQFPHIPPIEKFDDILLRPSLFFLIEELKAFFGILILMDIHVLPNISLYWSSDPMLRVAEIANVMTVKRFKKILANLHLNDNSQMPKRDEEGSPSENDLPSNDGSHRGHGSRGDRGNHYGGERPNSRRHRGGRRGRGGHDNQPSQARILASPEREPCEFIEPECDSQRKKIIILEDIQLVPPKHAEIMANVEIHNIQQSPPGDVEIDEIQLSPPRDVEIQDLKPRDLLRIGTSDLDTVPYSPDYLDSLDPDRLDTEINRALMAKTPKKRGIPSANSSSINPLID
ncbi:unnamed protein product [Parnassius apollo]|uniref:(apollo) hypothetical protein n=1 Tax=Parnassius apollo TaxID=110799 RepID=A0A8S3XIS9_PARAO|nr:unnamed protein product [Parnassius apollo]